MAASDVGTLPSNAQCLTTPEMTHPNARKSMGDGSLSAEAPKRINPEELTSGLMPPGGLEVPAYVIHPADVPLINRVAGLLQLSVVEYAQLAPHLHASAYQRMENRGLHTSPRKDTE